ncbi:MAG TPA: hypothetical protein PLH62_12015, partial [Ferruginibacter sp.]|nr:hypothetical protein [Ferruginibacter sp.]
ADKGARGGLTRLAFPHPESCIRYPVSWILHADFSCLFHINSPAPPLLVTRFAVVGRPLRRCWSPASPSLVARFAVVGRPTNN